MPLSRDVEGRPSGVLPFLAALVERIAKVAEAALEWALVVALGVMLGCVALQVFMRFVFGSPPSWAEEVAVLMFSWLALGVLPFGVRKGFHVRVIVYGAAPPSFRLFWERLIDGITLFFGLFLLLAGWRFVEFTRGGTSAAAQYPVEILHTAVPVSGTLTMIFALARILSSAEDRQAEIGGMDAHV